MPSTSKTKKLAMVMEAPMGVRKAWRDLGKRKNQIYPKYNKVKHKRGQGANNPSQESSSCLDPMDKVGAEKCTEQEYQTFYGGGQSFGKAYTRRGTSKANLQINKKAQDQASSPMEDLSDEVALLSQVEESISGARNKNSKSNSYMGTPVTEVCKSDAGVAGTEGCPIALEVSQALGCQVAANSSGSGELPMHIDEHSSVGIDDVSLDKSKCDLLKANSNSNVNGLSKTDLHQFEGIQQVNKSNKKKKWKMLTELGMLSLHNCNRKTNSRKIWFDCRCLCFLASLGSSVCLLLLSSWYPFVCWWLVLLVCVGLVRVGFVWLPCSVWWWAYGLAVSFVWASLQLLSRCWLPLVCCCPAQPLPLCLGFAILLLPLAALPFAATFGFCYLGVSLPIQFTLTITLPLKDLLLVLLVSNVVSAVMCAVLVFRVVLLVSAGVWLSVSVMVQVGGGAAMVGLVLLPSRWCWN
ncbi:hypothetical protein U1Q18_041846 [Sarracenia purpurea var. burkii]